MATAPDVGLEQDSVLIGEDDLLDAVGKGEERDSVVTTACIGELLGFFSSQNYRTSNSDRRVTEQVGRGLHACVRLFCGLQWQATFSICSVRACGCLFVSVWG